jgi:hypothetical protein
MKIIAAGDSWTFGSEICDPIITNKYDSNVHVTQYDYLPQNDSYRLSKIWPTILGNKFNCEIINLAWPADDNTTILQKTINFIVGEYLSKNKSTEEILLVVGWSSPERNVFWYKDETDSYRMRIWPLGKYYPKSAQENFWELYVNYFWNIEEYVPRFILNNMMLQNFCATYNIKWLAFNSFYQTPNTTHPEKWIDFNIEESVKSISKELYTISRANIRDNFSMDYTDIWNKIDSLRFYKKNCLKNSFKSFIEENSNEVYSGWHPSEESHRIWANELYDYLIRNKLL